MISGSLCLSCLNFAAINKILLECCYVHLFMYCLSAFALKWHLNSWNTDCMTHENLNYLPSCSLHNISQPLLWNCTIQCGSHMYLFKFKTIYSGKDTKQNEWSEKDMGWSPEETRQKLPRAIFQGRAGGGDTRCAKCLQLLVSCNNTCKVLPRKGSH